MTLRPPSLATTLVGVVVAMFVPSSALAVMAPEALRTTPAVVSAPWGGCTTGPELSCWGVNNHGQLGRGTRGSRYDILDPAPVPGVGPVRAVAVGSDHACAARAADGQVLCWGANDVGQMGTGAAGADALSPTPVAGVSGVTALSAGDGFTCAIMPTTQVRCWGYTDWSRIDYANNDRDLVTNRIARPVRVRDPNNYQEGLSGVTQLRTYARASCALASGRVACWGLGAEYIGYLARPNGGAQITGVGRMWMGLRSYWEPIDDTTTRTGSFVVACVEYAATRALECMQFMRDRYASPVRFPRIGPPDASVMAAPTPWLDYLNARYRRPMGLPDAWIDSRIQRAAESHTTYWALNGYSGHFQDPGKPGYVNSSAWMRCRVFGAPDCGEVAFPRMRQAHGNNNSDVSRLETYLDGWLRTPYHGEPLMRWGALGCSLSAGGAACNGANGGLDDTEVSFYGPDPHQQMWQVLQVYLGALPQIFDPQAEINTPTGWLRVWPAAHMRDVPTQWWGLEIPDPLSNWEGNRDDTGPMIFLTAGEPAHVEVHGGSGAMPLMRPGGSTTSPRLTTGVTPGHIESFHVMRRLAGNTSYTIRITRMRDGLVREVPFVTLNNGSREYGEAPPTLDEPALPPPRPRCRVAVKRTVTHVILDANTRCAKAVLQMRVGKKWKQHRLTTRLRTGRAVRIARPVRTAGRFRVRVGRTQVAQGAIPVRARR